MFGISLSVSRESRYERSVLLKTFILINIQGTYRPLEKCLILGFLLIHILLSSSQKQLEVG